MMSVIRSGSPNCVPMWSGNALAVCQVAPHGRDSRASRKRSALRGSRCAASDPERDPGDTGAGGVAPRGVPSCFSAAAVPREERGLRQCGSGDVRVHARPLSLRSMDRPSLLRRVMLAMLDLRSASRRKIFALTNRSNESREMMRARITLSARAYCVSTKSASRRAFFCARC